MNSKEPQDNLSKQSTSLNPTFASTDDDIIINTDSSNDVFWGVNDDNGVHRQPPNTVDINENEIFINDRHTSSVFFEVVKSPLSHDRQNFSNTEACQNRRPPTSDQNHPLVHFKENDVTLIDSSEGSVIVSEHSESSAFIHEDDEVYFRESSESSEPLTKDEKLPEGKQQNRHQTTALCQTPSEGTLATSQTHPILSHNNSLIPSQSAAVLSQSTSLKRAQEQSMFQLGLNSNITKSKVNGSQQNPLVSSSYVSLQQSQPIKSTIPSTAVTISPPRKRYNFPEIAGKYKVLGKIGEGTFSSVYKAISLEPPHEIVALKRIYPTSTPSRILNEIQLLRELGSEKAHVVCLKRILRFDDQVTLVLPYFAHDSFKEYVLTMTAPQVKEYMRALFTALAHLHNHRDSNGNLRPVIHRDVKPGNFLYSMKDNTFALVDFGLAHYQDAEYPYQPELPPTKSVSQSNASQQSVPPSKQQILAHCDTSNVSTRFIPTKSLQNNDNNSLRKRKRDENASILEETSQRKKLRADQSVTASIQQTLAHNQHASNATLSQFQKEKQKILESLSGKSNSSIHPPQFVGLVNQKQKIKRPIPLRGGTRGFRAPEVLLRCTKQTVAIDIWSAGVILLSILSARYPFFWSPDDMTSLAEIAVVCGTQQLIAAAASLGKRLIMSFESPKVDWKTLCTKARGANKLEISDSVYDLLDRCLDVNPDTRITALEALEHPFFKSNSSVSEKS
jgi:cell division control protein 7